MMYEKNQTNFSSNLTLEIKLSEIYLTGNLGPSGRAILICPDIWGWDSGRIRNIADHLAEADYLVVVPKILQPACVAMCENVICLHPHFFRLNGGTDGDALSPDVAPWIPETGGWPLIAQWLKENMVQFCFCHFCVLFPRSAAHAPQPFRFGAIFDPKFYRSSK
jgi:hypothetical protein